MALIEFLRSKLSAEDLALLAAEVDGPGDLDYETVIRRVVSRLKKEEDQISFARSRLELRPDDLIDLPEGRRLTILRNSSAVFLLVLCRNLIGESWCARFGDIRRSLSLATLAAEAADAVVQAGYLSAVDTEDLLAEVHGYLGNAQRINSDFGGAEKSLKRAREHMHAGSGDRLLKADHLMLRAFLRSAQGRGLEALALFDREIALRRLLGDERKLGFSLIQRGWLGCMLGAPVDEITDNFQAGFSRLADDHRATLQAFHAFAEYLAREGKGSGAWTFFVAAKKPLALVEETWFQTEHRWIKGLAHRAVRELEQAAHELRAVRAELVDSGTPHDLATVSLDLAGVSAAQGNLEEAKQLAEEAYAIFKAEGLEQRALTAVVVLQEAIAAERATEGLAVAVANYLARFPYNKALRFEWKGD